ncbi:hypothetical protein Mboo_1410 [Methanoregula boonei 6A8]|uniref:Uncharacterized protein n=1 Tax=Methanoregula boonei (strain DSM 21154 / JCM 14090 / 6A8) TaxID=456442 RepID=A7I867_METB6|nr:hypothetical protein [Methanoregula boonei]ABS55928.1 hypothetical protein Mboo_1410 [Methanoregula boonei 6A8]
MKKILLLCTGILFLIAGVTAYQVYLYAPSDLTVGMPLVVNGTTTFGIGTPIDVVLYQQVTTSTEIERTVAYVQSDNTFRVIFDTTDLTPGTYKVEIPASGTGDSITMRQVRLVERSDELSLSSPIAQALPGPLLVAGQIPADINTGVQIIVIEADNSIFFGPAYVGTDSQGRFNISVPVSQPGDYDVSFTDADGYIRTQTFRVTGGSAQASAETISPVAAVSALGIASREDPVYFTVQPSGNGPLTITTSATSDWIVEYTDADGNRNTLHEQGGAVSPDIVINDTGTPLYFKVYPDKYSVTDDISISATNADSIDVSGNPPAAFGQAQLPSQQVPVTQSPLGAETGIAAAGIAMLCLHFLVRRP